MNIPIIRPGTEFGKNQFLQPENRTNGLMNVKELTKGIFEICAGFFDPMKKYTPLRNDPGRIGGTEEKDGGKHHGLCV